ncbi:MAG: transcription elongation factor GreA [Candidatus Kerfeldbacteria bacterium]|nr:transcription elongation factor GreA [Candidatus Kerfeldbacteria bacterium]
MQEKATYLTKEGLAKLQAELEHLVRVRRKEIAARIQEAKELGDLSENAEYQEAKNEQAFNEGHIEELENTIKHAQIIPDAAPDNGRVQVGSRVKTHDGSRDWTFSIVGSNEADPRAGRISNESPLGRALLGKRIKDTIRVDTPKGLIEYTITNII